MLKVFIKSLKTFLVWNSRFFYTNYKKISLVKIKEVKQLNISNAFSFISNEMPQWRYKATSLHFSKKPSHCLAVLIILWHPLEVSPGEKFPVKHSSLGLHYLFLLQKWNHKVMVLRRISCKISFEGILASILGKVCRHLQWHHTPLGEFLPSSLSDSIKAEAFFCSPAFWQSNL